MSTSFATQLSEIAAKSTNELDLRAQKTAHAESLIFDKKVAASQDFDTIYQLCYEGFEDLCEVDPRFGKFRRSLFSQQSKTTERDQMTAEQNSALDVVVESCLSLLGARLLLSPAVKVAEWLVRRFRVHEHNTSFLLLTFLPYYATRIFRNLLSILPPVPPKFKFLGPYVTTIASPPRHAIAYGAINNDGFFNSLNNYALRVCQVGNQHQTLLSFWASITAEAVAGRLDLARSGRGEIQRQRQEDVLLKILPLLKGGLDMKQSPEMVIACYTIAIILASKSQLTDTVLDAIMEAVVHSLLDDTTEPALICLCALAQQKSTRSVPSEVVSSLTEIGDLESRLKMLKPTCCADGFALALVQSAVLNLRDKKLRPKLDLVERILSNDLLDQRQKIVAVGSLLKVLSNGQHPADSQPVDELVVDLLRRLTDSEDLSLSVGSAVQELGLDPAAVEAKLQSVIVQQEDFSAKEAEMDVDSDGSFQADIPLTRALERVQERPLSERSFLSHLPSDSFKPLLEAFSLASQSGEGLETFRRLPLWESCIARQDPLFVSFLIRVFSGPHPVHVRLASLRITGSWLSGLSNFDSQTMLPYVLLQLADPAPRIRKAASHVLLEMARVFPSVLIEDHDVRRWGTDLLYGPADEDQKLKFLSTREMSKIIQKAVLPALEECALDPEQSKRALQIALKPKLGNDTPNVARASSSTGLKKPLRQGLFQLLLAHILCTPLFSVKVGLLSFIENIERVGAVWKQNEIMSLLLHWASLTHEEAEKVVSAELLGTDQASSALCGIVSPTEIDAVHTLLDLCSSTRSRRPDMVSSVAQRIQELWPRLGTERQVAASESLLISVFHDQAKNSDRSRTARQVFHSVGLSTHVFQHLLNLALSSTKAAGEDSPAVKKRRDNHSQAVPTTNSSSQRNWAEVCKLTFVLELVDSSNPEYRPELLNWLFRVLTALHQLKLRDQSELSYLLSLPLGSLLSIVRHAASHSSKLDLSAVRLDVVVDCMRETSNSQVHKTALLLIAAFANIAPERVLDSIMPVFTFMSVNLMGRSDEYSNFVVDHTMENVIPPLIESLHSRNQDLIAKTSDLVSSFVVAFEHIPPHRRLGLFKRLISTLGDESFLFVVLARLTQRYEERDDVIPFIISLVNLFDVEVQLKTCTEHVAAAQDALIARSCEQPAVRQPQKIGDAPPSTKPLPLLLNLDRILVNSNIRMQSARLSQSTTGELDKIQSHWESLLERLIRLTKTPELSDDISVAANSALSNVLRLLPITQFVEIAERFIQVGSPVIRRKTLQLLESRISERGARNNTLQSKAASLLQTLYGVLRDCEDNDSKHEAITCVDKICRAYGRKDIAAVLQAAEVLSGDHCFRSADKSDAALVLLSLSSLVELAKEAIVPVVPKVMSRTFDLLEASLEGEECSEVYDAGFTLISTLLAQVPFIISEEYLDQIMTLFAESASAELPAQSGEVLRRSLLSVSRSIELTNLIGSLHRKWPVTVENDVSAVLQALSLFSGSVKMSSKSLVIKNVGNITAFLLQALDLRRVQFTIRTEDSYSEGDVSKVERSINSAAIEVIYKLNDSAFRPVFLRMMEWATKCPDVPSSKLAKAKQLRQTTLFDFLVRFFSMLKSIVTSYASQIVTPALAVLEETSKAQALSPSTSNPKSKSRSRRPTFSNFPDHDDKLTLYRSVLRALRAAFSHDQDGHFSNPTLFTPLSSTLTSQLQLASHPTSSTTTTTTTTATGKAAKVARTAPKIHPPFISTHVIPTIVSLATAILDTPDHLKSLNSQICNLRRSTNPAVRRASLETHLAIVGCATTKPIARHQHQHQQGESKRREAEEEEEDDDDDDDEEEEEEKAEEGDEDAAAALADEWCTTVLSVGEGMVYANELSEDPDPDVRTAAARLAARVRELVGDEEIFG